MNPHFLPFVLILLISHALFVASSTVDPATICNTPDPNCEIRDVSLLIENPGGLAILQNNLYKKTVTMIQTNVIILATQPFVLHVKSLSISGSPMTLDGDLSIHAEQDITIQTQSVFTTNGGLLNLTTASGDIDIRDSNLSLQEHERFRPTNAQKHVVSAEPPLQPTRLRIHAQKAVRVSGCRITLYGNGEFRGEEQLSFTANQLIAEDTRLTLQGGNVSIDGATRIITIDKEIFTYSMISIGGAQDIMLSNASSSTTDASSFSCNHTVVNGTLHASTVDIACASVSVDGLIDVTGRGWYAQETFLKVLDDFNATAFVSSGGSHGGRGGFGGHCYNGRRYYSSDTYGSDTHPFEFGYGPTLVVDPQCILTTRGGGRIRVRSSTVHFYKTSRLKADGHDAPNIMKLINDGTLFQRCESIRGLGGGAGGSILIQAETFSSAGSGSKNATAMFSARGGNGYYLGGGGGGGRISIQAKEINRDGGISFNLAGGINDKCTLNNGDEGALSISFNFGDQILAIGILVAVVLVLMVSVICCYTAVERAKQEDVIRTAATVVQANNAVTGPKDTTDRSASMAMRRPGLNQTRSVRRASYSPVSVTNTSQSYKGPIELGSISFTNRPPQQGSVPATEIIDTSTVAVATQQFNDEDTQADLVSAHDQRQPRTDTRA